VKKTKSKTAPKRARTKSRAKARAKARPKSSSANKRASKARPKPSARRRSKPRLAESRWVRLVEKHGVVLASARGPVPNVAEAVAGEPIVGGWWAHPKGKAIFSALSDIDDSNDIRCFKLIDGKVTFVHRRVWPALVRLARDGVVGAESVASVQQEHLPTGEHRNVVTPFPDWVDDVTGKIADAMTPEAARAQLGWIP
jgi:hypothetical protein